MQRAIIIGTHSSLGLEPAKIPRREVWTAGPGVRQIFDPIGKKKHLADSTRRCVFLARLLRGLPVAALKILTFHIHSSGR